MFVPKLSAPLTKAIRTSEGILVWLTNLDLTAGALIDPSTLPPKEAAIVASAVTGLHVASRTLLKVTALQQGAGIAPPVDESALVEQLANELAGKLGLHLPAHIVDEATLAKVVSEAVTAAGDPKAALHDVEGQLVSDAEEFAAQPPAAPTDSPRPESAIVPEAGTASAALPEAHAIASQLTTPADVPAQPVTGALTAAAGA